MMNNFTPRAQQVLALASKEAERFNHNYVGTEHLLLGLIKLGQGVAVNVLQKMGLDLEMVRKELLNRLTQWCDRYYFALHDTSVGSFKTITIRCAQGRNPA